MYLLLTVSKMPEPQSTVCYYYYSHIILYFLLICDFKINIYIFIVLLHYIHMYYILVGADNESVTLREVRVRRGGLGGPVRAGADVESAREWR